MKTLAVVPAKSLREAKGRLSGLLSPEERAELAHTMLLHVLEAIRESGEVSEVAVISPEPGTLSLPRGVLCLLQRRDGLNNLLEQGREWSTQNGADALMVAFADLPLLAPGDVRQIVELGRENGTVVLAPDRRCEGTNVLLAHPPGFARFAFGEDSYQRHRALHGELGAHIRTYMSIGTSLDIDTPDDLAYLEATQPAPVPCL